MRELSSKLNLGKLENCGWGLCALRHGIQISMEAILACHPARSTEWLDCHPKWCELWRIRTGPIGLASDDVTKLSNAWQRGKLVLNKDSAPYKSMLGETSVTGRNSLFLLGEIGTVLTTSSWLSASHFKRSRGSDKCGAVFRSIDDLPACFCMGRYFV